jgi:hypothetical protein
MARENLLIIPYGVSAEPLDGAPVVAIDRSLRASLRLNAGPYPFAEPPDLVRMIEVGDRLDFLRDHIRSLCGVWDKLPRLFVDAYFRHIAGCIAENRPALADASQALGGLFDPRDWSYSAPRPLPQAHLPAPAPEDPQGRVRVDFAFWTGEALVAIDILGSASRTRARREALERLRPHATILEIAGSDLQRQGEALLARVLPPPFSRFWQEEALPSSPFGPAALDEILIEPDEG